MSSVRGEHYTGDVMAVAEQIQRFLDDELITEKAIRQLLRKVPKGEWNVFRTHVAAGLTEQRSRRGLSAVSLAPAGDLDGPEEADDDLASWYRIFELKERAFQDEDLQRTGYR